MCAITVWLAEPGLGNRTCGKAQFLAMWQIRTQEDADAHLCGKFLAVFPGMPSHRHRPWFFHKAPACQSSRAALRGLQVRALPYCRTGEVRAVRFSGRRGRTKFLGVHPCHRIRPGRDPGRSVRAVIPSMRRTSP